MKNLITYLKTLWSWVANSQSSDVSHDCRLTVGSPSGLDAKLQVNTFMRFAVVLTLIFTIGVGNVWGGKITLTQSSLGLTGAYTSGTEKTVDGVTFVYTDLMKNSDNIQAKASTGVIYNKTAMPGNITEIKVTHAKTARSTTVYYGTTEQPTTNSNSFSGTKTISVSGSNKYFKITRGDNAAYWSSIEITYADAGPAYTVTASSNNNSYGTVEVSGTTITATPEAGYRVMAGNDGYTVTSGSATVVNNGDNTFTVTPSSDCTVRINFESKGCTDHGASSITGGALSDADHGPLHAYYDYSTSQILYTKSDLDLAAGKKGTIKSIYFEYSGNAAMAARTIKIYMANTDLSSLTTSNYVPYASFTQVYSGTFSCGSAGWYEITLDTPFDYNGAGQLAVMIDDNTNTYESSKSFKYHSATGKQIYKLQDDTDIDPASWTPASAIDYRPNTKFCIQEADMTPATVTLMDNGATITEASAGAGVTLPSRAGCAGYTFAGWTKTWVTDQTEWTTTAPTIISAGSYKPTADENLYPVYTKTEGGGGNSNITINFGYTDWGKGAQYSGTTYDEVTQTKSGITVTQTRNGSNMYANSTATRFYPSNTLTFTSSVGNISSVVFTCTQFQTDITTDVGTCTSTSSELSWSGNDASVTFTGPGTSYAQFSQAVVTVGGGSTTSYISEPACAATHAITFKEWDGGGDASGSPSTGSYAESATSFSFGATSPSKTGHSIEGFYTASSANSGVKVATSDRSFVASVDKWTNGSSQIIKTSDIDLYIKWTAKVTEITLDKGTGGTADGSASVTYGNSALTSISHATKTNYHLTGYYTAASDGTKVLNDDGTFAASDVAGYVTSGNWSYDNTSLTLYAQWEINDYPIHWRYNGDSDWTSGVGSNNNHATHGNTITSMPTEPTSAACDGVKVFVGWTATPIVGTTDTRPDDLFTTVAGSPEITSETTFYAVFATASGGGGGTTNASYIFNTNDGLSALGITQPSNGQGTNLSGTYTVGDVTMSFTDGKTATRVWNSSGSIDLRVYGDGTTNGTLTFSSTKTITKIAFTGTITCSANVGTYSAGTWTGEATSVTFTFTSNSKINTITVTTGAGTSYSDYSTTCGNCLAAPEVHVDAKTDHVILSWAAVDGATGYKVTCSEGLVTVNGTTATITGLTSEKSYTYTIQSVGPTPPYDCFPVKNDSFTTPGATIDVVEWQENAAVIYVDKEEGVNPLVIIDGEVEHGSISGKIATDLFFSKYFEGAGSMKLVAIFNGTGKEISLANYKIVDHHASKNDDTGNYEYSGDTEYPLASLGKISAGQEIIFFTRPQNISSELKLYECSEDFLDGKASENGVNDNPRWIECDGSTFSKMIFNGDDALLLQKSGNNIDVIGARTSSDEVAVDNLTTNCRNEKCWDGTIKNMDYGKTAGDFPNITLSGSETLLDYGIDLTHETISAYTARCILFRNKEVTSGDNAVTNNVTDFTSFTADEWYGRNVCVDRDRCEELGWTYTAGGQSYQDNSAATCNSYQDLGEFDYNSYYTEYENISDDTYLNSYSHDSETGEYTIPINNLAQYSCLNLRFQLKQGETVLTENAVQVPIIVKGTKSTNDAIFNEIVEDKETHDIQYDKSIERCQTCNVVVLDGATLTKAADNASHDVPQVKDLTIYPGGKLVVPSSTNYTVHSLALRRQEDEIPLANLQGTLNVSATKGVYLDVRIDPTNWHYIALPYDCNVNDITFANGETAKLGTDYTIARYDGESRATNKDGGWTDVTAGFTLQKGIGYIVSLPGTGKVRKELRFPMANGVIADEKQNKTISGLHAWGANNAELTPNHKGWNMIGNPYMMPYNNASTSDGKIIVDPLILGTLELVDGEYTLNTKGDKGVRYIVEPINNGWNGYCQTTINDMQPFTSYFIQVGDGSNDPATNKFVAFQSASVKRSVVRRMPAETEDNHPIWYGIEMVAPNGEKDNTALLISDDFTDEYDMMDDLVKMRGSYYKYYNLPVLASRNAKDELAFNALPDESAAVNGVPLNYYAAQAGTYTLRTDSRYDLEEVKSAMLHDAVANTWTNMLENDYTFDAAKGDNKDRFTLYVRVERKKAPEVATGCDNLLDGQLSLIAIDKTLVLSGLTENADVYVYDMSGKLLRGERANGNGIWRANVPAQGVYFVRVNSAGGQQTLRTIVK